MFLDDLEHNNVEDYQMPFTRRVYSENIDPMALVTESIEHLRLAYTDSEPVQNVLDVNPFTHESFSDEIPTANF